MTEHPSEHTTELPREEPAAPTSAAEPATPTEPADPVAPVPERPSGFHPVNVGHLVMGLAFVGLVLVWLLVQGDVVDPDDHGWVFGLPWLTAGAAGLAATVLTRTRRAP